MVPGKLFSEIVKNLPDAAVHVAAEDDSAVITCDTASFSIKTLDAEDFPGFLTWTCSRKCPFPSRSSLPW